MATIQRNPRWERKELKAVNEAIYLDRRRFLEQMGILGIGALSLGVAGPVLGKDREKINNFARGSLALYPAERNPKYRIDRTLTEEERAATFNNFYEFSLQKNRVWRLVDDFKVEPWQITIDGLCRKPMTLDVDDLLKKVSLQERLYRFRCVEAWSMDVPWTGFPMAQLVALAEPQEEARYVRFESFFAPEQAPNQKASGPYRWPYYEGLRLDEAMNELTLLATGIYGHPLPKQHGAPLRVVTPWKYGFKGAKSIRRITFTKEQPRTFWNNASPEEYGFYANVDPKKPHPRWPQNTERVLGSNDRVPTLPYNGYGEFVAALY